MTARFCKSITTASATHGMILAMKTILNCRILLPVVIAVLLAAPARAADPITDQLQQGLLEEEVNRDLEAAVRAYEAAVSRFDDQRRAAATAVFRLGECYRKLGRTEDAIAQYRRIQTEFADQSTLADLSRTNLARLGVQPDAAPSMATDVDPATPDISDEDAKEIARLRRLLSESPDRYPLQPLHAAASSGRTSVVRFLLDSGIQPNPRDSRNYTPLHMAAWQGHKAVVELLIERSADVNAQAAAGITPLHMAVQRRHIFVLETLLTAKPDLNPETSETSTADFGRIGAGLTPLALAVRVRSLPMVKALLDAGADINHRSVDGSTTLHHAVKAGGSEVVELLLERGAELNAANDEGRTPLDLAVERKWDDMIQLLRDRGAVSGSAE
jgi:ankyrin repeat protein